MQSCSTSRDTWGSGMIEPPHRPWETWYNNWDWPSRRAVTPIQNALFRSGQLIRPTVCSICGFSDPERIDGAGYIYGHLERYDRPAELYPACKACHASLHARFRDPDRWQRVLAKHGRPGDWATLLSLDPASQFQPFAKTYPNALPPPSPMMTAQRRLFDFVAMETLSASRSLI